MRIDDEKSYSEAMNEWARKNSFFGNRGNRLIHPSPALPGPLRALGYLLRVVALVFVLWLVVNYGLRKYVGSKGFGEKVGGVVAAMVGAEDFESSPLLWKGGRMSLTRFSATGGESAFYRSLDARYIRFQSSPLAFLGSTWSLDDVVLNNLDVKLRSGSKTGEVPLSLRGGSGGGALLLGGLGGGHEGKSLRFEELKVLDANVEWGLSEATRGGLVSGTCRLLPGDSGWRLEIAGGTFGQTWLQGITVERLTITEEGGVLQFRDGELALASGGKGTLAGTVALGALPKVDLTLGLSAGALSDLLPKRYATYVDARIEGELRLTGSVNTKSGIEIAGDLRLAEGILRNIPVLESVSILTETTRVRNLPITSGTLRFTTREGALEVTALEAVSKDTAMLRGSFAFARDMEGASEKELIGLTQTGADVSPLLWSGNLRIGVLPKSLVKAGQTGEKYFSPEADGYRWMEVVLSGEMEGLTAQLRDQMLADIKKLRESR